MSNVDQKQLKFHPSVEELHVRIDPDRWKDIVVVGDIHGCAEEFETLLKKLSLSRDELLICVGDLINKGPSSSRVVDLFRNHSNFTSVRGNNEQKVIEGRKKLPELNEKQLNYLRSLPVVISWDQSLVVHGGLDPDRPIAEHDIGDFTTFRSVDGRGYDGTFWFEKYEGPPRVFFGHTVLGEPFVEESFVGLDTGCVYGGSLTAYRCSNGEVIQVHAGRTVQERNSNSIIEKDEVDL